MHYDHPTDAPNNIACLRRTPRWDNSSNQVGFARRSRTALRASLILFSLGQMNPWTANDRRSRAVLLLLSWTCALSPFIVLFVVATAAVHQPAGTKGALGPLADAHRAMMRPILDVAWSLSMMFAAYLAGPLWVLLLCIRRCRLSWKTHSLQGMTLGLGWLLIWALLVEWHWLNRIQ
ncbi:MAG: hypothetical protein DME23_04545 [Verrucomicrobia bacterium]|nr:MAG: hypothetical protein DME23_04545 [Verrucomicrobiota bacterium]